MHAVDRVVALVQLDRVREQRAAVVPGDGDDAGTRGADQRAAELGQPGALRRQVVDPVADMMQGVHRNDRQSTEEYRSVEYGGVSWAALHGATWLRSRPTPSISASMRSPGWR